MLARVVLSGELKVRSLRPSASKCVSCTVYVIQVDLQCAWLIGVSNRQCMLPHQHGAQSAESPDQSRSEHRPCGRLCVHATLSGCAPHVCAALISASIHRHLRPCVIISLRNSVSDQTHLHKTASL